MPGIMQQHPEDTRRKDGDNTSTSLPSENGATVPSEATVADLLKEKKKRRNKKRHDRSRFANQGDPSQLQLQRDRNTNAITRF